jgi:hypothetical protein
VKDGGDDLLLDDAAFLETLAKGFDNVKIKPRSNTGSEIQRAHEGTKQFRDRSIRLRAIARRLREGPPA